LKDIKVERFSRKLDCGATVEGFREIIYDTNDDLYDEIFDDFKEEN